MFSYKQMVDIVSIIPVELSDATRRRVQIKFPISFRPFSKDKIYGIILDLVRWLGISINVQT